MKIVINTDFGGFGLSGLAIKKYLERKGKQAFFYTQARTEDGGYDFENWVVCNPGDEDEFFFTVTTEHKGDEPKEKDLYQDEGHFYARDIPRDDPDLVVVVEEMGSAANGRHAVLKVVEIPDDVKWHISEYDGREHIAEDHRTWG